MAKSDSQRTAPPHRARRLAASSFLEHTSARVTAIGDIFDDRLKRGKERLDKVSAEFGKSSIDASNMFRGPKAYEGLLASDDVDAVYIATPPYFHPQHLEAAIDSGKHIYLEKPVAVDVPGCKNVMEPRTDDRSLSSIRHRLHSSGRRVCTHCVLHFDYWRDTGQ